MSNESAEQPAKGTDDSPVTNSAEGQGSVPQTAEGVPVQEAAAGELAGSVTPSPDPAAQRPRIEVGTRHVVEQRPGGDRPPRGGGRPMESRPPGGEKPPRGDRPRRDRSRKPDDRQRAGGEGVGTVVDVPRANVPVPSKREGLTPELEAELNEVFGGLSLDQVVEQGLTSRVPTIEEDSRTRGTIMRIAGDNVFISLGGRNEGVVSSRQFKQPPTIGAEVEIVVKSFHPDDGLYDLVLPGAAIDVGDWSDLTQGVVVEARITGANTGGLECMVNNIRGFIPSSQIGLFRVENFADYINQKLPCVVTEVNPRRKNLVLSHRALLEREKEANRKQFLEQLEPGQVYEGVVRKIQDFGVFVDIGGADGLVHVSQLSWDRVNHPSEVVQEGQKIRVKVDKVNTQTGKISLSHRDTLDRPWDNIEQRFSVGSTVKGPVSRIANFGAFVKLAPGIEGLIHISELAHGRVRRVEDVLKEGQEVEVKVLSIDPEAQRIALSYRATLPPPAAKAEEGQAEVADPLRAPAVPRRNRPLRGGFDRPTGGEHLGLKW